MSLPPPHLDALKAQGARLPRAPGVYLFKDEAGRVLYVGKATDLRARVATYLRGGDARPLMHLLLRRAAEVEAVRTETPEDALLLENTLIKKEKPPYNLRLKDDKTYLLVRVGRHHPFPRLRLVRRIKRDGAHYIGPFASAKALRSTLRFLRTLYPLRTCSDRELDERTRPCLYHQIGRCSAPCVGKISTEAYGELVRQALALLRGRDDGVRKRLQVEMQRASDEMRYEHAALVRDRLVALETALERQTTVLPDGKDRDVIAVSAAGGVAMLGVVYVRGGQVVAVRAWPQRTTLSRREVITAFLSQFYLRGRIIPPEILVEEEPVDLEGIQTVLGDLRGSAVAVRRPQRGPTRDLVALAARHAAEALAEHSARSRDAQEALALLAHHVGLEAPPQRIEGYDLSHLGGDDPVAGMSVLVGGVADTSSYRHFRVKTAAGGDDYAGMHEVIARRFDAADRLGDLPDLVMVDGGRGQVEAARRALLELGLSTVPVVGLAKARPGRGSPYERIVRPGHPEPLVLPETDAGLRLLVRLRNEAHRFAGRYQKKRRALGLTRGALDGVPGIGEKRKRMLIERFGSLQGIKEAPFEDLAALPGIGERRARMIRERLEGG